VRQRRRRRRCAEPRHQPRQLRPAAGDQQRAAGQQDGGGAAAAAAALLGQRGEPCDGARAAGDGARADAEASLFLGRDAAGVATSFFSISDISPSPVFAPATPERVASDGGAPASAARTPLRRASPATGSKAAAAGQPAQTRRWNSSTKVTPAKASPKLPAASPAASRSPAGGKRPAAAKSLLPALNKAGRR